MIQDRCVRCTGRAGRGPASSAMDMGGRYRRSPGESGSGSVRHASGGAVAVAGAVPVEPAGRPGRHSRSSGTAMPGASPCSAGRLLLRRFGGLHAGVARWQGICVELWCRASVASASGMPPAACQHGANASNSDSSSRLAARLRFRLIAAVDDHCRANQSSGLHLRPAGGLSRFHSLVPWRCRCGRWRS